jgi:TolB-like protein/tetratricopeptide (TPR) repeat protein
MRKFLADFTRSCSGIAGVTALVLGIALSSARAQTPSTQAPSTQAPSAQAPSAQAPGAQAPAPGAPAGPPPTIAVLPLENSSGEAAQDFFASGMTDEVASALTGVRGLAVVARSSSFRLPPSNHDLKAIGQALNARYLVQGSARLATDRVRMNIRLVQAGDGVALWSKDYDAEPSHVFDLEEDIAGKIAAALKVPTPSGTPLVRSRTADFDAYLDFLRGKVAVRERGAKALADAAVFLEGVVIRDPDFAPAAALLAYDYALTPLFAPSLRGGLPQEERKIVERAIPRSDALARRATKLDPQSADAFVALGYANLVQRKMLAAEDAFKQALALNPNQADGLHGYSQFLAAMGRIKPSLAMRDHLQAIEQSIINYTADTAEIYWLDGDTEKAVAMLQPFRPGRTLELALVQASAGRYREAAAAIREMPAASYPPGMTEAAAKILESAPAKATAPAELPRLGNLSFAYMHVGAPERVLEFYEDEIKGGYFQPISTTWFWHPTYAAVRKTARFKALARDLGLVEYWSARGWPPQCRAAGADFSCD